MTLQPILNASAAIQIHLAAASVSLALGAVIITRAKGTRVHAIQGKLWTAAMTVTALSSWWIVEVVPGRLSPIHVLSAVTLASLANGIVARRRGDIATHRRSMLGAFVGLLVAALFTLTPGRILARVLMG